MRFWEKLSENEQIILIYHRLSVTLHPEKIHKTYIYEDRYYRCDGQGVHATQDFID